VEAAVEAVEAGAAVVAAGAAAAVVDAAAAAGRMAGTGLRIPYRDTIRR